MSGARLSDVAARAGVSEATVSRVLNGKPGVSPTKREAVIGALDALGYERPRRLQERRAGLVGLVVPEMDNPVFPAFAQALERALARPGIAPILCTQAPAGGSEDESIELLLEHGVHGIVFVSGMHTDTTAPVTRYTRLLGQGVPIVLVNGPNEEIAAPSVSVDDALAMRMAVTHLADLGHERIGLAVGQHRLLPVIRKIEGFRSAMAGLPGGEPGDGAIAHSLYTSEGGQAAAAALLDEGCTAVVCASDLMALGAVRAVRARGLRVPGDVSVIGFDDSRMLVFTDPPLTTVRQPVTAMATAAVDLLMEAVSGRPQSRLVLEFQPELIIRGSTGAAPARVA
ncbi:LacI family DNA-binding transcriptional regulator [Actinomadura viridis]|uniref:LacI family DNA-binding transcriptional regulator n=1 Tax=Actinomadura viridis TaxID=58110 RepID=UPI0036B01548